MQSSCCGKEVEEGLIAYCIMFWILAHKLTVIQHSCSQQQGHVHEMCHKKTLWFRSLYIIMKLANNTMLGCMFVTYTDICKHIMFPVQADHHGTSVRFHFHVRPKPLCSDDPTCLVIFCFTSQCIQCGQGHGQCWFNPADNDGYRTRSGVIYQICEICLKFQSQLPNFK